MRLSSLDPSKQEREVSEEVSASLAALARDLERTNPAEPVADFLMRCLLTLFAEGIGRLEENLFTSALEKHWISDPASFPEAIEGLWRAMSGGTPYGLGSPMRRFCGGLFESPSALKLTVKQLEMLLEVAKRDWSKVEPAIFGALLEQALNPKERHRLGAHYTPRAYVERLVRPTVEEPLRAEWDLVRAEVWRSREEGKLKEATQALHDFHTHLTQVRVLDPACGTGNFLYVTLDILKQIESEILLELREAGEKQEMLVRVSPAQLLGIEVNPRARAIAELVLWLGHLQWHYRSHDRLQLPEPVLQNLGNIECRDAVLTWDAVELVRDARGRPIMRWDGETMKRSSVTGQMVPDEEATVPAYEYIRPRKAEWPEADFIVGNPPFIGNKRMRLTLGDGYVDALREAHEDVSDTADYVMYWWNHAAGILREGRTQRFGLITTNSITQTFSRKVVQRHLDAEDPLSILFAIPDHPWVDIARGAAVRVAMTACERGKRTGRRWVVVRERDPEGEAALELALATGKIQADLTVGANVSGAKRLAANMGVSFMGVTLVGDGFRLSPQELTSMGYGPRKLPPVVRPYRSARELFRSGGEKLIIDFFGLEADEARRSYPALYGHVLDRVKPMRDHNHRSSYRERWWIFGEPRIAMRAALHGLKRFIVTLETSKHRVFVFLPGDTLPDHSLFAVAIEDAFALGVLSSRVHAAWALAAGSRLGVGNDPRWRNVTCFEPFPFPLGSEARRQRVRELGEALDAHRRRRQAAHPELTITGMYNVLERLRAGAELRDKDKLIHEQGLVSTLAQIHDELDAAVFDAYGWSRDLTDGQLLEELVALNTERAQEEGRGLIRWLRPELQDLTGRSKPTQTTSAGLEEEPG